MTQRDSMVRMVSLENLKAMCARMSGMCHRFEVGKVTKNRVYVTYSNPDEYGNESPITCALPSFPSHCQGDEENPTVIMEMLEVYRDNWNGEGWQAFEPIMSCEALWRNASGEWKTEQEIKGDTHA